MKNILKSNYNHTSNQLSLKSSNYKYILGCDF